MKLYEKLRKRARDMHPGLHSPRAPFTPVSTTPTTALASSRVPSRAADHPIYLMARSHPSITSHLTHLYIVHHSHSHYIRPTPAPSSGRHPCIYSCASIFIRHLAIPISSLTNLSMHMRPPETALHLDAPAPQCFTLSHGLGSG